MAKVAITSVHNQQFSNSEIDSAVEKAIDNLTMISAA